MTDRSWQADPLRVFPVLPGAPGLSQPETSLGRIMPEAKPKGFGLERAFLPTAVTHLGKNRPTRKTVSMGVIIPSTPSHVPTPSGI